MRFIRDIHAEKEATGKPTISFEFFPFKTSEGEETFFGKTLPALMTARPDYASVTYGAGGSTREKTLEIVERIQNDFDLTTMAHLTCVRHTQAEIRVILDEAHVIKDRSTSTAKAVFYIESKYKWCLTGTTVLMYGVFVFAYFVLLGTPLQNRVSELYSLVRFLRIVPYSYYYCKGKGCKCESLHYVRGIIVFPT